MFSQPHSRFYLFIHNEDNVELKFGGRNSFLGGCILCILPLHLFVSYLLSIVGLVFRFFNYFSQVVYLVFNFMFIPVYVFYHISLKKSDELSCFI